MKNLSVDQILTGSWLGNSFWAWVGATCVAFACMLAARLAPRFARKHYAAMAETERTELMEVPMQVLAATSTLFIVLAALYLGLLTLELPRKIDTTLRTVLTIAFFWQAGIWGTAALLGFLEVKRKAAIASDRAALGSLGIIGFVLRFVVWALVLLLTLDNLGIDVTTLVAGLGVGGIAIALAVQNVLGDLLASLSITLDRPFVVGDFLILGDFMGSVEYIGIKSVRLRSLSGEQIIIANADLLGSRVRNYGRMIERRVVFSIGVTYETPRASLQRIPTLIREAIERETATRFDRSHFAKYGDFSLDFETVYYVLSPDYNVYMDIQQRVNFAIHEAFERESIEFAYPTRKLYVTTTTEEHA